VRGLPFLFPLLIPHTERKISIFTGYSPQTVDFLWGIRMNNNREWFMAHKPDYVQYLYEPTKALGKHIFEPFLDKSGTLLKVSRIYRDARMHHPLPYKESLWICIRQDVEWWAENPCLFFEITPDGISYGFFFYHPSTAALAEFRQAISQKPDEFLKLIKNTEKAVGIPVTADLYKRPKPTDNPALQPYFAWKGQISCIRSESFSEETFGPELADRVKTMLQQLTPLYDYFCRFRT